MDIAADIAAKAAIEVLIEVVVKVTQAQLVVSGYLQVYKAG